MTRWRPAITLSVLTEKDTPDIDYDHAPTSPVGYLRPIYGGIMNLQLERLH